MEEKHLESRTDLRRMGASLQEEGRFIFQSNQFKSNPSWFSLTHVLLVIVIVTVLFLCGTSPEVG